MTIHERLAKKSKNDLYQLRLLFASDSESEDGFADESKAEMARHIEESMRQELPLLRQITGAFAVVLLNMLFQRDPSGHLPLSVSNDLQDMLEHLKDFGLANRTRQYWQVDQLLREAVTDISQEEHERLQEMQNDSILLAALLDRYGMLRSDKLLGMAAATDGTDWDAEYLWQVMITHYGFRSMWAPSEDAVDDAVWFVSPMLTDPENLFRRLQLPFVQELPYAPISVDEVELYPDVLAGKPERYQALIRWYANHGADEDDAMSYIRQAAEVVQEHPGADVFTALFEHLELSEQDFNEELLSLINETVNRIPLWHNKGWSAEEMVKQLYKPGTWSEQKKPRRPVSKKLH